MQYYHYGDNKVERAAAQYWEASRGEHMDLRLNDIVEMKKPHPCGEKLWLVTRVGMDIKLKCTRCGREVMLPRAKAEKGIKKIVEREEPHE